MPAERVKAIHSVGWVGQFTFVGDSNTPYTGIFEGSNQGLIRFSMAKDYSDDNITPGFGIKFLRNNMPSCNFVAMPSLDGQSSKNFFANN